MLFIYIYLLVIMSLIWVHLFNHYKLLVLFCRYFYVALVASGFDI
jgi:hypothetical protein